jgi:hypothetical protein
MSPRSIAACVVGIVLVVASPAAAQSDGRRDAAHAFAEATKAFDAGDYTHAAKTFELAYSLAPHADALWNAARAWHMAGERARAANLYAQYLREVPPNAADRASATSALKGLSAKLGRIDINVGAGVDQIQVDDVPTTARSVYVVPGVHVLRASSPKGPLEQQPVVKEGQVTSVVLATAAEPVAPAAPPPVVGPPPEPTPDRTPTRHGWSPTVVWIGGGLTLVLAGIATWSGIDTVDALHEWERAPTQSGLDDGKGKQLRTNILIGGAVAAGIFTGAAALWLVDWQSDSVRVGLGVLPGGIAASGKF